jgi:hypothetical protein
MGQLISHPKLLFKVGALFTAFLFGLICASVILQLLLGGELVLGMDFFLIGPYESVTAPLVEITWDVKYRVTVKHLFIDYLFMLAFLILNLTIVAVCIKKYLASAKLFNGFLVGFVLCIIVWSLWGYSILMSSQMTVDVGYGNECLISGGGTVSYTAGILDLSGAEI